MTAVEQVVPESRPTLFDLSGRYDMTRAELEVFHRIYGLHRVPVWDSTISKLAERAVELLLKRAAVDPETVRWVVHAHTGTQLQVVGESVLNSVCKRLGLYASSPFGMSANNCASSITAMQVLDRLLTRAGPDACAIVVTADVAFTPILQVIPNSSVTGDAAVACLFRRYGDGHRVLSARTDTYGQHAGCQWQDEAANAEFEDRYPDRLARTMRLALETAGLSWSDIRLVLPHNINTFSWKRVAAAAGVPLDLIYLDQVPHTAHCFGADIVLNLMAAAQEHDLRPGDRLMLATVGLGAVFGAAVVEYAGGGR